MSQVILCLWIHGLDSNPKEPCGEVDTIEFSGERIRVEFIEYVTKSGEDGSLIESLRDLPTEIWLDVRVQPSCDEGDWYFNVIDYNISTDI